MVYIPGLKALGSLFGVYNPGLKALGSLFDVIPGLKGSREPPFRTLKKVKRLSGASPSDIKDSYGPSARRSRLRSRPLPVSLLADSSCSHPDININVRKARSWAHGPPSPPFPFHCWSIIPHPSNIHINVRKVLSRGPWTGVLDVPVSLSGSVPYVSEYQECEINDGIRRLYRGVHGHAGEHPFHCWPLLMCATDNHFLSRNAQIHKTRKRH